MFGWVLLTGLAVAQTPEAAYPQSPLSKDDLELLDALLAQTSTPAFPPPDPTLQFIPPERLHEPIARSTRQALERMPVSSLGPFGHVPFRTESLVGFFVEPSVGGWQELPPELYGGVRLDRSPTAYARADVDALNLLAPGAAPGERPIRGRFEAVASSRSADRSGRLTLTGGERSGALSVQGGAFVEGSDGLLRVRRGEPSATVPTREARGGGLVRLVAGGDRASAELVGAVDGRWDPATAGAAAIPSDVQRHLIGGRVRVAGPRAQIDLRGSVQGGSRSFAGTPRQDSHLGVAQVDALWRPADALQLSAHHLGTYGVAFDGRSVLRSESGLGARTQLGALALWGDMRGVLHELGSDRTLDWAGRLAARWGAREYLQAEVRRGVDGLGALLRDGQTATGIPGGPAKSVRVTLAAGLSGEAGFLRAEGGSLWVDGDPLALARVEGAWEITQTFRWISAAGWTSRLPEEARVGRPDLLRDGAMLRSSLRWDPPGGVMEVHVASRLGATSFGRSANDFVQVGGFAGIHLGSGFWLRAAIANAVDADLPEEPTGETAGIDLSVAVSWSLD